MIYTNLNNSGEIEAVYAAKRATTTGTPPLSYPSKGYDLEDFLISGNTVQDGTPSADAPADVVGCGVRTGNLWNEDYTGINGNLKYVPFFVGEGTFTLSTDTPDYLRNAPLFLLSGNVTSGASTPTNGVYNGVSRTTDSSNGYITIAFRRQSESTDPITHKTMLNLGSTALPYEPYGYKLDISSGGENLLDESTSSDADTTHINYNKNAPIVLTAGQTYTFSCDRACNGLYIRSAADDSNIASANNSSTLTYTPQVNVRAYCRVWNSNGITNLKPMLNLGSTALQYSPYNRTATPIFLGQVETMRRIKKLVLTGAEDWSYIAGVTSYSAYYRFKVGSLNSVIANTGEICSHYQLKTISSSSTDIGFSMQNSAGYNGAFAAFRPYAVSSENELATWKNYLAAKYANGTPVTAWYVLAEPETSIVNEPLMKIGDYADTISLSQSGITVPTTAGTNTITTETTVLPSSISVTTPEKEVAEVYAGINYQNPVYYKSRTLTGTSPLTFKGLGQSLKDWRIYGETLQNGTPSPVAPVDVVGCGVRTEQIFEDKIIGCSIDGAGRLITNPDFDMYIAKVEQGVIYTASARITGGFYTAKPVIGSVSYNGQRVAFVPETITAPITGYMVFRVNSGSNEPMLNLGSTTLPYEPYGYKLPPTVNGTEYPIYLGEVESTRRIKKLVLTGEETWMLSTGWKKPATSVFYMYLADIVHISEANAIFICSNAFAAAARNELYDGDTDMVARTGTEALTIRISDSIATTVAAFKSYLAAQYAAGTPVTVWYVLAEPETAVVNEPLMKIGDYADTISFAQAEVVIPTVSDANVLDMTSPVKPSEVYIKGSIKPTGYGQLVDKNSVRILDKNGNAILVHGQ